MKNSLNTEEDEQIPEEPWKEYIENFKEAKLKGGHHQKIDLEFKIL